MGIKLVKFVPLHSKLTTTPLKTGAGSYRIPICGMSRDELEQEDGIDELWRGGRNEEADILPPSEAGIGRGAGKLLSFRHAFLFQSKTLRNGRRVVRPGRRRSRHERCVPGRKRSFLKCSCKRKPGFLTHGNAPLAHFLLRPPSRPVATSSSRAWLVRWKVEASSAGTTRRRQSAPACRVSRGS